MENSDFVFIREYIKKHSGINITENKSYLVETRLGNVLKDLSCANIAQLVAKLRVSHGDDIKSTVVKAMTTNESSFFRDNTPFDFFKNYLINNYVDRGLKIWSAAASTGQEAYSLSILLKETVRTKPNISWEIVGTDIDGEVLDKAKRGIYSDLEVRRGLTEERLSKNFSRSGKGWKVNDDIKENIIFFENNLVTTSHKLDKFDVVFCRNVLIYFDDPTKKIVLKNIRKHMNDDAYLFVGCSEFIPSNTGFKADNSCRGLYKLSV